MFDRSPTGEGRGEKARPGKKGKHGKISPSIPRFERHIDLPEHARKGLKLIGVERSEKLVWVPGIRHVIVHVTYNHARVDQESAEAGGKPGAISTCMPPRIMPGSIATSSLLARIITSKFADGPPYHRQQKIFARHGVELTMRTMCRWAIRVAEQCNRLLEFMLDGLLQGRALGIDETRLKVLVKRDGKNAINAFLFLFHGGTPENPVVIYFYRENRKTDFIADVLARYEGAVQTDAYSAHDKTLAAISDILHIGCWMHNRRPYFEAAEMSSGEGTAQEALGLIRQLYMVEREARGLPADEVLALRREKSKPIMDDFKKLIDDASEKTPPTGKLGEAIRYSHGEWEKLVRFLDDGALPIDNGRVENAIRLVVVGRKNFLHSGGPRGARALAALYSIVQTAILNGHDPYRYLLYLFELLPRSSTDEELRALLPNRLGPKTTWDYASEIEIPAEVLSSGN
jgi:transposase